jgi:hypothetical protein
MATVGRFQVMATLQAARAYLLGKSLCTAKSFGLNRALFYAATKKDLRQRKIQNLRLKFTLRRNQFQMKNLRKFKKLLK